MADFDFSTLITDRTQADLDALRELLAVPMVEWMAEQLAQFNQASSKGAYNYTDLNRVTQCMDYINNRLIGLGYSTGYQKIKIHYQDGVILPEGYTELEYIESSGTQYIDTGFKPNQNTRVIMESYLVSRPSEFSAYFGVRTGSTNQFWLFWNENQNNFMGRYNTKTVEISSEPEQKDQIDFNKNQITVNGLSGATTETIFQSAFNMFLFSVNSSESVMYPANIRVFSCQIYDNGTLIRDYVPAKNSSEVVGLYDLISGTFYQNAGTGAFIAGPEIVSDSESNQSLDQYTWYEEDIPTNSQMLQYISNINALRSVLPIAVSTPDTPGSMESLTLEEANAIEKILVEIEIVINSMSKIFLRSGTPWVVSGALNPHFAN